MKQIIYFILVPIFFTVVGEFLLKIAVDGQAIGFDMASLQRILFSFPIIGGVALISVSAILWIVGMSKFQLSFINYVIIIVGSEFFLNEDVQLNRYLSILFIIIGLVIISRSPHVKIKESS